MMTSLKKAFAGAFIGGIAMLASAANAVVISGNTSFDVDFSFLAGSPTAVLHEAETTFTISNWDTVLDTFTLTIEIENTTTVSGGDNAALYAFGFNVDPDADTVAFAAAGGSSGNGEGLTFDTLSIDGNLNGVTVDICLPGSANCPGGSQASGLAAGANDVLVLDFAYTDLSQVEFTDFRIAFQGTNGSFQFPGDDPECVIFEDPACTPPRIVSEPAPLAALGFGLLVLGYMRRRKTL